MDGLLKVTPEKLLSSSEEFGSMGVEMNNLTRQMMEIVNGMRSFWQGEAQGAYNSKFSMLQADMDKLYRMVEEHSKDLSEMARNYQETENVNMESGQNLESNVVS
ncbi:MAG: WXG100 family type VII secretion target [Lachnospiraceae bacterium]|nr:WXG100 family type VII secretion target [Lachnospiraceae bacterium]